MPGQCPPSPVPWEGHMMHVKTKQRRRHWDCTHELQVESHLASTSVHQHAHELLGTSLHQFHTTAIRRKKRALPLLNNDQIFWTQKVRRLDAVGLSNLGSTMHAPRSAHWAQAWLCWAANIAPRPPQCLLAHSSRDSAHQQLRIFCEQ